jgi:ribosomal protein L1
MSPENEKPQKPIIVQDEKPVELEFSMENSKVIQKMVGKYGVDPEDVVINALILLYTISQKAPNAKQITVQGPDETINVPLTIVS